MATELPLCPICCETLGKYGGPATLPCGHNGCLQCLSSLQQRNPQCPLCRTLFDSRQQLVCNHELHDLIAAATRLYVDQATAKEGWEAFPTSRWTSDHYTAELAKQPKTFRLTSPFADASSPEGTASPQHSHNGQPFAVPTDEALDLDPPTWLPDSYATQCGICHLPFKALFRLRHHCRMCGKIFCHSCCRKKLLLPPKWNQRDPHRVCELCSYILEPLQPLLTGIMSRAAQPPVHDAMDGIALRSWMNSPWTSSMEEDIYKAANILQGFTRACRLDAEKALPAAVLHGAKGLAILSVLKIGLGWSGAMGTGLLVSRLPDGNWSAPCAVSLLGVGWGLQVGGELRDVLLVLHSEEAVRSFCGSVHVGVGGGVGVALGALGRQAEASLQVGDGGHATAYSYSMSKGAFLGVSVDGSCISVRHTVNLNFYGYPVTPRQLLVEGALPQPAAAITLYDALHVLVTNFESFRQARGTRAGVLPAPQAGPSGIPGLRSSRGGDRGTAAEQDEEGSGTLPAAAAVLGASVAGLSAAAAVLGSERGVAPLTLMPLPVAGPVPASRSLAAPVAGPAVAAAGPARAVTAQSASQVVSRPMTLVDDAEEDDCDHFGGMGLFD